MSQLRMSLCISEEAVGWSLGWIGLDNNVWFDQRN